MVWVIIFTGFLFIGIAYILTENNAKYLLSGYNTMSKEERQNFDLKSFLPFFKKFHTYLGISIIIIGLIFKFLFSNKISGLIITLYCILAYIYFIANSPKYYLKNFPSTNKLALIILSVLFFVVLFLAFFN